MQGPANSGDAPVSADLARGSVLEVLFVFLKLGVSSFGGPVAHLGYFRSEFVDRRHWLDDKSYGDLVALCQFLPGPASSQVGMALGLMRAGWTGALAAWVGFTLPSAVALILFAYGIAEWSGPAASGALHGLKVVAVAVVAQAVWSMAKTLCPDRLRAGITVGAALIVLTLPTATGQIVAIVAGALIGRWALKLEHQAPGSQPSYGVSRRTGAMLLAIFAALLGILPLMATADASWSSAAAVFYKAGALVFGGGHVVLPLLQTGVVPPGWVSTDAFLAGYGAAQAVPGPLFTFAAYLGAVMPAPLGGWTGGLAMLVIIFVPAFLLVAGTLPFWEALRQRNGVQGTMGGINAAVVGVLGAALYDPIWTAAIQTRADFALALAAFALLVYARLSAVLVVALAAIAGWLIAL